MSIQRASGACPVCGREIVGQWRFESDDDHGVGYVHEWASPISRTTIEEEGKAAYTGDACYQFADGRTKTDQPPPQPIKETSVVPKLN